MSTDKICKVCGNLKKDGPKVNLGSSSVSRCEVCFTESVDEDPDWAILEKAYRNFDAGSISRNNDEAYFEQSKEFLVRLMTKIGLKKESNINFFDYGCGGGHFLRAATALGFSSIGMELDEVAVDFGRKKGLEIIRGTLPSDDAQIGSKCFDLILSTHVLEHVLRPGETFAALVNRLKPNGHLYIAVPDQDSFPAALKKCVRHFGFKKAEWGYVQPPIHLHAFCAATFRHLAVQNGLEIVSLIKTSPLRENSFPTTSSYWKGLFLQKLIYEIAKLAGSPGYLAVLFRKRLDSTLNLNGETEQGASE